MISSRPPRLLPLLLWAAAASGGVAFPVLAEGPGLGNLSYGPSELFQAISVIHSPRGHGNAAMVNGYLMAIYSSDSGGATNNGGIEFWDVSDPRNPSLVAQHDDDDTHELREAHGFGFSNSYPGDYLVAQAIDGVQFWDVTDPLNISLLDTMSLPEISGGDYDGIWWVFWQAPWVYAAGVGKGLYVIDATDPTSPVLVNRVLTSEIGGVSPSQAFAVGNLLVLMTAEQGNFATMDISDPVNPTLIQTFTGVQGYSHLFAAGRILTSGTDGVMGVHDVAHDGTIALVGSVGSGLGAGGYGTYQDGFFHSGFSQQYAKFDVASLTQLGSGSAGIQDADEDFGFALGNVVWVGDDRTRGTGLIVHDLAPDTAGPDVHWVHPPDGATDLALTTRVGISMSDNVDIESVGGTTFAVRPLGGSPLPGKYSVQFGLVNFSPDAPLASGVTYEVVVNGIRDLVGNPGGAFASSFTTTGASPGLPSCTLPTLPPAEVGTVVGFDVAAASGAPPLFFSWDFGDGSPPTPASLMSAASHTYAAPGRYPVIVTVTNGAGGSTCGGVQIVHYPPTTTAPGSSSPIVHDGTRCFNVNPDQGTVTAIEEAGLTKVWERPVGPGPRTLAKSPTGDLWVVNEDDATIHVLSAASGDNVSVFPLPRGSRPYGLVFSPDGAAAYVTLQATGRLLKLDPGGNIVGSLDLGPHPRGLAISGDSDRILVTRFISPADHAEIWDVDPAAWSVVRTIDLAFDPGPDTESSGRGVPNYLTSIHISPDGRRALIPSKKDNVARGLFRDGQPLTFESRTRAIVSFIDLVSNTELFAKRIDLNDRNMPQSLAFSPLGDLVLVGAQGSNRFEIFDANDGTALGGEETGLAPQGMALSPTTGDLFVHDFMSRAVSVFDTQNLFAGVGNSAPPLVTVPVAAGEALSPEVLLGKRIFYDASDPRMSRDGYVSCAGCHLDGGSDGQVWDFTQVGEGLRDTVPLTGRAGTGHGNVHWTANFDEIQDFENDIRGGFDGTGFLTDPEFAQTQDPLGPPKAGLSPELDALAAYAASLDRFPASPWRNADGTLTPDAEAGRAIFAARGCRDCHAGPGFTDGLRHDVGTIQASSGLGIGQPLAGVGFETPTLLGLWETAPYLHNGQAPALIDVLDNALHGGTDALTASERAQLAAYLLQLEDDETAVSAPTLAATNPPLVLDLAAHPNPFRPATTLRYTTPVTGAVRLTVHDVSGRLVRVLVSEPLPRGRHEVVWKGRDGRGDRVAAGVYFFRLQSGDQVTSRKIIAVR